MPVEIDSYLPTRVLYGVGSVDVVGKLACEIGTDVFVVTDPGVVAAGHVARVEKALVEAGCRIRRFDAVREDPKSSDVDRCRQALGDWAADMILGVGGGSSIDVAKGCNFVAAGGGRMEDYWGVGKAEGTLLPLIAVPTTAGTGTEVQSFALIEQDDTHQKMACGDPQAAPVIALLDPALTVTQPRRVTACTGLDAIGHAVETAVTTKRNAISERFSTEAFVLAQENLPRVLQSPDDVVARGHMQRAATFAGIAIEHSMLGAAHSMANPLTARYNLTHGQAVGMMLPVVVAYNAEDPQIATRYAALARAASLATEDSDDTEAVAALVARLRSLVLAAGFEHSLRALDIPTSAIDDLASEAAKQWTAHFNPRPVSDIEFRALYARAFS